MLYSYSLIGSIKAQWEFVQNNDTFLVVTTTVTSHNIVSFMDFEIHARAHRFFL